MQRYLYADERILLQQVAAGDEQAFAALIGRYWNNVYAQTLACKAARWYAVEFVMQDHITQRFSGQISRNVNASRLLHILELTGKVHFEIRTDGLQPVYADLWKMSNLKNKEVIYKKGRRHCRTPHGFQ